MQEKKLIFNVKELPHVFNVSMELTNITSDSEQENVKKEEKNFIFPFLERKVKRKRTVRRFIFPGKERRKNPTQKAYFIRAVRKKKERSVYVFS